jgi:hypothetical protein
MIEPKYIEHLSKGDRVQYMQKLHTVQQQNARLFIQYTDKDGSRKRLYMEEHPDYMFSYGSKGDYIFNEWWRVYDEYDLFKSFVTAEQGI